MKKKEKSDIFILPMAAAIVLMLGIVWVIDTIHRKVFPSDAEAILIDDRFSETKPSAETQSISASSGTVSRMTDF